MGLIQRYKNLDLLSRILIVLALILCIFILLGTLFALIRPPRSAKVDEPSGQPSPYSAIFELGPVRAQSKDAAATVLISLSFPYDGADLALSEEIRNGKEEFRQGILKYFSSLSAIEIEKLSEKQIYTDIQNLINKNILLGKIDHLWLHEYMIFK